MALEAVGSTPTTHPNLKKFRSKFCNIPTAFYLKLKLGLEREYALLFWTVAKR